MHKHDPEYIEMKESLIKQMAADEAMAEQMRSVDRLADDFRERIGILDPDNPVHPLALISLIADLTIHRCIERDQEDRLEWRSKMLQCMMQSAIDVAYKLAQHKSSTPEH